MTTQIQKRRAVRSRRQEGARNARKRTEEAWRSITVNAPPEDCYRLWREPESLAKFLSFVDSVLPVSETRARWVCRDEDGQTQDSIVDCREDASGRSLVWTSVPGMKPEISMVLRFDPATGNRGTVVRLRLQFRKTEAIRELHRFKQWKETGEIPTTQGQPAGKRGPLGKAIKKGEQQMKALCWYGKHDVRVDDVPEPRILNPRDVILKVTRTAICGSDLHLYNHFVPTVEKGDILGHEFMGEVVEVGPGIRNLTYGDRVVIPFPIACGQCFFCRRKETSLCENSNPNAWLAEKMWGHSPSGIFGYSHLLGGYAGGQAQFVRVPYADVGAFKVPEELTDEQVLFLSDILPTGWMAAEACNLSPGDTVVVWGCGPVGQFAIRSAYLLGAERVIAIDHLPYRLRIAAEKAGAETINFDEVDVAEALDDMTGGRGPDACIDAVGMEAHVTGAMGVYDRAKQALMLETDRPAVLRQAFVACRNGGTVSVPGVYGGVIDKVPFGSVMNRALTLKTGQTHVHRYMEPLLRRIQAGEIDPTFIITHRLKLADAPKGYDTFLKKEDDCLKVVLTP